MTKIVTITRQGQLTIPKSFRDSFGITGARKVSMYKRGRTLIIEPKDDFWSLAGSLHSDVSLSDTVLKSARKSFGKTWPRKV